ncbi:MAG: YhjD/YihY/BrkB family envelope integrity protein [Pseudomonadota bacterium]|nr:YhjD/YihY/BrkB family envelope integrity protein [Pseudomonadota bacterium]
MPAGNSYRFFSKPPSLRKPIALLKLRLMGVWDITSDAATNFDKNGDTNQAAAISLYAILSFIPLFILTILMANEILGAYPRIQQQLVEGVKNLSPYFSEPLLRQLGGIEEKKRVLGWIGIVTLIWFSSMIFGAIETAFHLIFRSRRQRSYLLSKLLAIAMIPMGWAVAIASLFITSLVALIAKQPLLAESILPHFPILRGFFFQYGIPYLVTVLFFTIVYKAIPTVNVPLGVAVAGGALFSALMELAKHFFTWYVANYTRYNIIFGSLEAVVILVIWIFYVALILLFCAEIMASFMRRDMLLLQKALFPAKRKGGPSDHKWLTIDERLFRKFGRIYPQGAYIFQEGDPSLDIYYILSGRVQLEKTVGSVKKVLADMGPGAYFGEIAALIASPRTASAKVREATEVAVIDSETFHGLLRESDRAALLMLKEFSLRIKRANDSLEGLVHSWLCLVMIVYFLKNDPFPPNGNFREELAALTGKDANEIEATVQELVQAGILKLQGGRIAGFDRERAWEFAFRNAER